ncbi:MAG: nickel pincer cofactor biosynthesis protein LarC [Candidatus Hodarchaeota archaeon]
MNKAKKVIVIDCQSAGISGDMTVGALIDLGASQERIMKAAEVVERNLSKHVTLAVEICEVERHGIKAKAFNVVSTEEPKPVNAKDAMNVLSKCLEQAKLSNMASDFALQVLNSLIKAESRVHGKENSLHLHELASADTFIDILGTAAALDDLRLFGETEIYSTPVAVGGGSIKFSHGTFAVPAPATLEILRSRNYPIVGGPIDRELTTPTGAAILVNLAESSSFYPPLRPIKIGYGAGSHDFEELTNVLRIVLGKTIDYSLSKDEIYVMETNVDDVSGEVLGYTLQRLFSEGVLDVTIIPTTTKKSRPGYLVKLVANAETVEELARVLMEETGTLGVRFYPCSRYVLKRRTISVGINIDGLKEKVRVKIAEDTKGNIIHMKPEYDDIEQIAKKTNLPFSAIESIAKAELGKLKK